jgi:hypothetical protein
MMITKKQSRLEPRKLALAGDVEFEGAWRVEYFDSDGALLHHHLYRPGAGTR